MIWDPLRHALDACERQGRIANFWLRDDDAVEPSPALLRLAALTRDCGAVLAVIPAAAGPALAALVADNPQFRVAVHGWSHANHAPLGEKKQELGPHRPAAAILAELRGGREKLAALFGDRLLPLLVPPWNRIDSSLLKELRGYGFDAVSLFGPAPAKSPIATLNTHVDLIDWRGTRAGRGPAALIADIVRELDRRQASEEPLGILSHHLVNDETAFRFIEELLHVTAAHKACRWLGPGELLSAVH